MHQIIFSQFKFNNFDLINITTKQLEWINYTVWIQYIPFNSCQPNPNKHFPFQIDQLRIFKFANYDYIEVPVLIKENKQINNVNFLIFGDKKTL